jgi:hypothetical protein
MQIFQNNEVLVKRKRSKWEEPLVRMGPHTHMADITQILSPYVTPCCAGRCSSASLPPLLRLSGMNKNRACSWSPTSCYYPQCLLTPPANSAWCITSPPAKLVCLRVQRRRALIDQKPPRTLGDPIQP